MSVPPDQLSSLFAFSGGGTPTHRRPGVAPSFHSLSLQTGNAFTIPHPDTPPDGGAGVPAVPAGGNSGLPNVARRLNSTTSHQGTFHDHVLENPDEFDDAPYIPPRVPQSQLYPSLDPRAVSVYDPTSHDFPHQYAYEGNSSPVDSVESSWSNSSSSSASSQQLLHDFGLDPVPPNPQTLRPPSAATNPQHFPSYSGHHHVRFDHPRFGEQPSSESYYTPQSYLSPAETYNTTSTQATLPPQIYHPSTSSQVPSSSSSVSITNLPQTMFPSPASATDATGSYLRKQLGLLPYENVNLRSLPDPPSGQKPTIPLPVLVKVAIYGSPNRQLTLQEIYAELENRFKWFRDHKNDRAWKNSIRHNLSLNKVFRRVPRPVTEPGKGSYWQLDLSEGEGYKRPRKRRTTRNRTALPREDEEEQSETDERMSSLDPEAGASGSSATPFEDPHIDPELRAEGHVVGEHRARSVSRRTGGIPYPSQQSPRYQQGPLPVVSAGQDPSMPEQRFGQPAFGFPHYSHTRPPPFMPSMSTPSSLAAMTTARAQPQHAHNQIVHVGQSTPQSSVGGIGDPGAFPALRRARTYPDPQGRSQDNTPRASSESSTSGSARTWKGSRAGFQ